MITYDGNGISTCAFAPVITAYMTEFWKVTHMGACEIIRSLMFSGLLIRAGHSFENISRIFLLFKALQWVITINK